MFRPLKKTERDLYVKYVDAFYHTDAVDHPVPEKNYAAAFDEIMRGEEYLKCYIFEVDNTPCGFALLSKTFSQEAGGISVTVEEIYIEESFRGRGLATELFDYLKSKPEIKRLRIEVEDNNEGAKRLYERTGFKLLPYLQMVIDR